MRSRDILRLSVDGLFHRGLRSWLTILGIVIGVAAVLTILSIGAGTQQTISGRLGGLGADVLTVSAGSGRATGMGFGGGGSFGGGPMQQMTASKNLTEMDAQLIETVDGVAAVNGIVSGQADLTYLAEEVSVSVQGVDPIAWVEITSPSLSSGRYLTASDSDAIIIGDSLANDAFKTALTLNTQVTIEGKSFRVVGILSATGTMLGGSDNSVVMTESAAREVLDSVILTQLSSIQVKVEDANEIDNVSAAITEKLMVFRHVTENTKDFTVTSEAAMQETISSVMSTLNLFLTGIAATSLLVGAIGIANTMFMSVLERTRQIGTLKALGATNYEIMKMFLFESAIIGFVGGLLGVFLGFIISGSISELGVSIMGTGMRDAASSMTAISPELVLFSIGFSVLIGIISGIIPARRASGLLPVEALRFE